MDIEPLTRDQNEFIRQVRNGPEVNRWLASPSMPISAEDQDQWFDWYLNQDNVRRFVALAEGKPVGYGLIKSMDLVHRSAEVGLCIASEHWRKGYGRHLLKWLVEQVLVTLNLHRCWLDTFADNERAVRLYEAVGFKCEGLLRENRLKDGCYRNSLVMSILDWEWLERKVRSNDECSGYIQKDDEGTARTKGSKGRDKIREPLAAEPVKVASVCTHA